MIAIDGVAPQAKMCQQRTRRFMSAHTEHLRKGIEKEVSTEACCVCTQHMLIIRMRVRAKSILLPSPTMAFEYVASPQHC